MVRKMGKDKDKLVKEKERLDAEVARSLAVVEMKKAHKRIEDVEKLRKKSAIKSIIERINYNLKVSEAIMGVLTIARRKQPTKLSKLELTNGTATKKYIDLLMLNFEAIRFDLKKNVDLKEQDFDKLFPTIELKFDTYDSAISNLNCLNSQMINMATYCSRLL
jgi:hypothetical protein